MEGGDRTRPWDRAASTFDERLWSLASARQIAPFEQTIGAAQTGPKTQISVALLIATSKLTPMEALRERNVFEHVALGQHGDVAWVTHRQGDFAFSTWRTPNKNVHLLVASVPVTDARWKLLERWVRKTSLHLNFFFLNHAEFAAVGEQLARVGNVEVNRITAKNLSDWSSIQRGFPETPGRLRPDHLEAIGEIERNGASVRTMSLLVQRRLSVHLRRVASATYHWGDFRLFNRLVIESLTQSASARLALLQDRQRPARKPLKPPVSIVLPGDPIGDLLSTATIVDELQKLADINVAILHRNPYLHVAVTDMIDGSNFDVIVTGASSIEIYSGYRASDGALARVTAELSDRFQAERLEEARPATPVTLDDIFSGA